MRQILFLDLKTSTGIVQNHIENELELISLRVLIDEISKDDLKVAPFTPNPIYILNAAYSNFNREIAPTLAADVLNTFTNKSWDFGEL